LGIYSGSAEVLLGGKKGILAEVVKGDAVLIPAGVAHKKISSKGNFMVVGAYPFGEFWDMCYGKPGERPGTDENIKVVALPKADPVYGKSGPVMDLWYNVK